MRDPRAGFTLIELLVVIGILSLLVVTFAPDIIGAWGAANTVADQKQLTDHFANIQRYKQKFGYYPRDGGHKFVLDPWVRNVVEHTDRNFDKYFNPAQRANDPYYQELRQMDMETLWPDLESVTSLDTHYAGRARDHKRTMESGKEAWMSDDNEDVWSFQDGTINVLWGDGKVTSLVYEEHLKEYGWPLDGPPLPVGPDSPVPELQKLEK